MESTHPFLIGVATSGYQSEGGYNGPGEPHNNWAACEHSGRVERTGLAGDFWHRYQSDFALTRGLGLNAFRLGIEWTRIQPGFSTHAGRAPAFDLAAVDAYADRIAACRASGLEPVVTLQHFTHPAWLGVDVWLDDATPAIFEGFVRFTVERLNQRLGDLHSQPPVKWYLTLNEPNMLVLNTYLNRHFPGGPQAGIPVALRAYNRLLAAHVQAYNAIHDIYEERNWPRPLVSMNTFCSDVYWSENMILDALCLRKKGIPPSDSGEYFSARAQSLSRHFTKIALRRRTDLAAMAGAGLHGLANFFASRAATSEGFRFFFQVAERAKRDEALDYLGLDYYDPFVSHVLRRPDFSDLEFKSRNLSAYMLDVLSSKWWDWHFLPEGMSAFCDYYAQAFSGLGILIAENGMSQRCRADNSGAVSRRDGLTRSTYLEAHLLEVRRMLDQGVPLLGYLHWSLTDNYEWGSFTPRFGLFRLDYQSNLARLAKDHLGDNPSQTYARLVQKHDLANLQVRLPEGLAGHPQKTNTPSPRKAVPVRSCF
jgi:beta-glucosidase/6-phospho-beta-glucosidase/beta-galactosidase